MFLSARRSLSVCVLDYSKTRAWIIIIIIIIIIITDLYSAFRSEDTEAQEIWMKCCVSTDVGTWKN